MLQLRCTFRGNIALNQLQSASVEVSSMISWSFDKGMLAIFLVTAFFVLQSTASADDPALEEVVVEGRRLNLTGEARSASEGVIGRRSSLRPLLRRRCAGIRAGPHPHSAQWQR